jgi:hypothetical protein
VRPKVGYLLRPWGDKLRMRCLLLLCRCVCRQYLRELRDYQQQIKLFDESAEEIVRDATRKQVRHAHAAVVVYSMQQAVQVCMARCDHVVDLPLRFMPEIMDCFLHQVPVLC